MILTVLLYILALAPGRLPPKTSSRLWTTAYADRGLHAKDCRIPENSLAAFSAAAAAGYGIELDLQLTADGEVVVFHDDNLLRLCGIDRAVADCTWQELQQFNLCESREKIPLFSEVLTLVNGRVPLLVELKTGSNNKQLCQKTAQLLDNYQGLFCIESFHPGIVLWFKKNRPQIVRGQLSAGWRRFEMLPKLVALLLSSLLTNIAARPHFVAYHHEDAPHQLKLMLYKLLGGKLLAWTVTAAEQIPDNFDTFIFEYFLPPRPDYQQGQVS